VLDAWGPRFISVVGCGVSVLGLVLFGVSHSGGFDAFVAASLLFSEPTWSGAGTGAMARSGSDLGSGAVKSDDRRSANIDE
jgi:hypothetical protein